MSSTQSAFEEAALQSNGGLYTFATPLWFDGEGMFLAEADLATLTVASSPLATASGVQGTYTPAAAFIAPQPLDPLYTESNPDFGTPMLEGGALHFLPVQAAPAVVYDGSDVVLQYAAPDGGVTYQWRITQIVKVPLSGTFAQAPQDFRQIYGGDPSHISATATFAPDAAFYRYTVVLDGDYLAMEDGDANPSTDPRSATGLAADTIEAYFALRSNVLSLPRGTIKTVKGSRCWINDTADSNNAATPAPPGIPNTVSPAFNAYCEAGSHLYRGQLQASGSTIGTVYMTDPFTDARLPYLVYLNKAAADSVQSMFH